MKNLLTILILLITVSITFSQQKIKLKKAERVREYIDLSQPENEAFFYQDLRYLDDIVQQVSDMKISSFDKEKSLEFSLSQQEVFKKFVMNHEGTYSWGTPLYYGRDFYTLCFEKIVGEFEDQVIEQINWVHFYVEKGDYKFSISYKDFHRILKERNDLYVKNVNGALWQNNIFLTHGNYLVDYPDFHKSILEKALKKEEVKVEDYYTNEPVDKGVLEPIQQGKVGYNMFLDDSIIDGNIVIDKVGYEYCDDLYLWGKNKRYVFSWDNIKELNNNTSKVYKLEDAFRYSLYQSFKVEKVKQKKASISTTDNKLVPYKGKIITHYLDAVLTTQPENEIFQRVYPNFMEKLVYYTFDGKIAPYVNDSLTSILSIEEFDFYASKRLPYEYNYSTEKAYLKGDTVVHNIHVYRAKQPINKVTSSGWGEPNAGVIYWNTPLDTTVWEILPNNHYDFSEIEDLECSFKMTFNEAGNDMKLELEGVVIYISAIATGNDMRIQFPLATYKWKDVKKLFPNPEFIDYMENRKYFSYFLKTDLVKPE